MADDVVVQTETSRGTYETHAFANVPASRASWIVLQSSESDKGRQLVAQLRDEIEAVLMASVPGVTRVNISAADPKWAASIDYGGRVRTLVLVASPDAPFRDVAWFSAWDVEPTSSVMTVLPTGDFSKYFEPQ